MPKINRSTVKNILLLLVILVGGFLVRLYKIDNPIADWHSWRQADTASVTRSFIDKGVNLLYPRYHDVSSIQTGYTNLEGYRMVEFPVFNLVHYFFYQSIGVFSFEIWGRLVSIFSALATAIVVYKLGERFVGTKGGFLASAFYLFIPYNIYFTRVILPEPLSVFLGLASVWFFVKYFDHHALRNIIISGIMFALSVLVKPFSIFFGIPLIYLVMRKYKTPARVIKAKWPLIFLDIVLVPFLLWRGWISQFPQGIPRFVWAFNGDNIRFRPAFWRWIFAERLGTLILGVGGVAVFVEGLLKSKTFVRMFFLGSLVYMTVFATANIRHDYYQTFIIPPLALLLAQGTLYLWEGKRLVFQKIVTLFLLVIMFLVGIDRVKPFYAINHYEIVEAGAALDRLAPREALVIAPYNGDTAFLYQTKRWGWPVVDSSIPEIAAKGAQFYVSVNFDKDTEYAMANYKVVEKTEKYVVVDLRK